MIRWVDNRRPEVPVEDGRPSADHQGSSSAQVFTMKTADTFLMLNPVDTDKVYQQIRWLLFERLQAT